MKFVVGLLLLCAGSASARETYEARPGLLRPGGFILFYISQGPLSSNPMTRKDLPADAVAGAQVFGKTCQYGLSVPLSLSLRSSSVSGVYGDGGFRRTLEKIRSENPGVLGLFDVRVDLHLTSVLGVYRRRCTEVTAVSLVRGSRRRDHDDDLPPPVLER